MSPSSAAAVAWLPNVVVSLRVFKPSVHKLLNDHGGQMPLMSFLDCYRACIVNETTGGSQKNNSNFKCEYQLIIDNENGVPLEHLATCAQDVIIKFNEGIFKQLQWENDKTKPASFSSRGSTSSQKTSSDISRNADSDLTELDESMEESQRKQNQFSHEVVELFKGVARCIIPLSKFNIEYHKKYGRQCRVADYGYTKLYELLESIPHILQILGSEYEKKLTLTHRVQVRRFSNDLTKVLKAHSAKQMFADEYPAVYEKHFGKLFDIRDYGVCFLEDMLAELPESTISRKEIDGRTFIQIPKIVQLDEERLCTERLTFDIIDMLRHKPRFSIQFNKFIPNFHHHFGRQCKLSNYGFTKLIELLEAMPKTVQVLTRDALQFVQLQKNLMIELICQNIVKLIEDKNFMIQTTLTNLESFYNYKYEKIHYEDFGVENIDELFANLPLEKYFIEIKYTATGRSVEVDGASFEYILRLQQIDERDLKRICKLALKKLIDETDELIMGKLRQHQDAKKPMHFRDIFSAIFSDNELVHIRALNNRSMSFIFKSLVDLIACDESENVVGFTDLYYFAKQIRALFKKTNCYDMPLQELEALYKQTFKAQLKQETCQHQQQSYGIPYKKLGFVDVNLLFIQGLKLMISIKKSNEKRIFLNKEFWPRPFLDATPTIFNNSFNSPQSPMTSGQAKPQTTTPVMQRTARLPSNSSSNLSSSMGFKRNVFSNNIANF